MKVTKIGSLSAAGDTFLQRLQLKHLYAETSDSAPSGEVNLLMANFAEPLSEAEHIAIKEAFDNDKAILYFEDVKAGHFPDNALIRTDADTCVIKSEAQGRIQQLFILKSDSQGPERDEKEEIFEKKSDATQETIEPESSSIMEAMTTEAIEPKTIVETALDWLDGLSMYQSGKADPNMRNINASMAIGNFVMYKSYNTNLSGKQQGASLMAAFDIELVADSKNLCKMVRLTSTMSQVNPGSMPFNSKGRRGDATYEGTVIIYPGDDYIFNERSSFQMPQGWSMAKRAPLTKNGENTYTYTTGWSVGAEGGGEIAQDPKVTAKVSVSYSATEQKTTNFKDFELQDLNVNGYCYWRYYFTQADRDWTKLLSGLINNIEPFPDLATSAMVMNNEVVYRAPAEQVSIQNFCFNIGHQTMCIYSDNFPGNAYFKKSGWIGNCWGWFSLNMGAVKFPPNI